MAGYRKIWYLNSRNGLMFIVSHWWFFDLNLGDVLSVCTHVLHLFGLWNFPGFSYKLFYKIFIYFFHFKKHFTLQMQPLQKKTFKIDFSGKKFPWQILYIFHHPRLPHSLCCQVVSQRISTRLTNRIFIYYSLKALGTVKTLFLTNITNPKKNLTI